MRRITLLTISFLLVQTAHSGVYKCVLDGKTTYSQKPCEGQITEVQIEKSSRQQIAVILLRISGRPIRNLMHQLILYGRSAG